MSIEIPKGKPTLREDRGEIRQVIYHTLAPAKEIVEKTINVFRSMLLIIPS